MKDRGIKKIAIIGAGLMGYGIGIDFARAGFEVALWNRSLDASRQAMTRSREALDHMVEADFISSGAADQTFARLHPSTDLESAAGEADYVVESISERLPLKKKIFQQLDQICPPPAILATNTSTLKPTIIAEATKHPYGETNFLRLFEEGWETRKPSNRC